MRLAASQRRQGMSSSDSLMWDVHTLMVIHPYEAIARGSICCTAGRITDNGAGTTRGEDVNGAPPVILPVMQRRDLMASAGEVDALIPHTLHPKP